MLTLGAITCWTSALSLWNQHAGGSILLRARPSLHTASQSCKDGCRLWPMTLSHVFFFSSPQPSEWSEASFPPPPLVQQPSRQLQSQPRPGHQSAAGGWRAGRALRRQSTGIRPKARRIRQPICEFPLVFFICRMLVLNYTAILILHTSFTVCVSIWEAGDRDLRDMRSGWWYTVSWLKQHRQAAQ